MTIPEGFRGVSPGALAPGNVAGGKRKAQAAKRRQQLLETALQMFSERGYRETSVREITCAAGVTEAVLYHYFASKSDLLTAVLAEYAPFARTGRIIDAAADGALEEVLTGLGNNLLALMRAQRQLVLTMLSQAPAEPDLAIVLGQFLETASGELGGFLARRQAIGQVDPGVDVFAVARAFNGGILLHFLMTTFDPDQQTPAAADSMAVDQLVAALMLGIAPKPGLQAEG